MSFIPVSKPDLPNLTELQDMMNEIWKTQQVTNNGQFLRAFEQTLSEYFGGAHVSLCCNATLGLMAALRASGKTGNVITSPFSFPATVDAILWAGLKPKYLDISEDDFNLSEATVLKAITCEDDILLPVNTYGHMSNTNGFNQVATKHGLTVIYDAAQSFGIENKNYQALSAGDFYVISLHATKVFNSIEGGLIISKTLELKEKIDRIINFGFNENKKVVELGFNAKMNEIQAAIGLLNFKDLKTNIRSRSSIVRKYNDAFLTLEEKDKIKIHTKESYDFYNYNFAYYPVVLSGTLSAQIDKIVEHGKKENIEFRRYFYPLLSEIDCFKGSIVGELQNAKSVANRVLCLPLYASMSKSDTDRVIENFIVAMESFS